MAEALSSPRPTPKKKRRRPTENIKGWEVVWRGEGIVRLENKNEFLKMDVWKHGKVTVWDQTTPIRPRRDWVRFFVPHRYGFFPVEEAIRIFYEFHHDWIWE